MWWVKLKVQEVADGRYPTGVVSGSGGLNEGDACLACSEARLYS